MNSGKKSILSPALFALVLVLFMMPFVEVSCSGQQLSSLSGYDLAFGYEPISASALGDLGELGGTTSEMDKEGPEWTALLALGAALVGLGVGFIGDSGPRSIIGAACGIVGALMLFLIMVGADGKAEKIAGTDAAGMIQTSIKFGLWASMLVFIGAAAVNVMENRGIALPLGAFGGGGARPPMGGYGGPGAPGGPGGPGGPGMPPRTPAAGKFCPKCGTQNTPDNAFCASCGERL